MSDEVYRRLARHLDELPNRFPETRSGVEFRVLAKVFSPEEAALALVMGLTPESFQTIAARAGLDPKETRNTLKRMTAKGLLDLRRGQGEFTYALRPFVVGFYEGQLARMDAEMAGLFEQYYHDTEGGVLRSTPALHRVIPVEKTIPFQVVIHPYERASALIESARSWAVRECICRKQRRLLGKGCRHPLETCIVFAPVENAFARSAVDRAITKEEALRILQDTEEAGLVHSSGNYRDGHEYICNCCTCCCGIMRGIAEYGIMTAVARSGFRVAVERESCTACEACLERCQFKALSMAGDAVAPDLQRCVGCGLCVLACQTGALHLEPRPAGEVSAPPRDIEEWRAWRQRGST